jgi:hypothetical protein
MARKRMRISQVAPSSTQSTCECQKGFRRSFPSSSYDGISFGRCEACPAASSFDRLRCVQCDGTTGPQHRPAVYQNNECQCSDNADGLGVILERDATGALFQDGNGTFLHRCVICSAPPAAGRSLTCGHCEYPKVINSESECVCPTSLPTDARCSNARPLQRIASALRVDVGNNPYAASAVSSEISSAVLVSTSAALREYLDDAIEGCYDDGNREHCNALANLCVLQQYDRCA